MFELLNFLMIFLFILFVTVPLSIFIHELGHALVIILFSRHVAYVYVGVPSERNKEKFRIGRLRFHLRWPAGAGFCGWDRNVKFSKQQLLAFFAAGPLSSLFLSIGYYVSSIFITQPFWSAVCFNSAIVVFIFHFFGAIIPMQYPRYPNGAGGGYSDGWSFWRAWNGEEI